jgi:hypothetical protein
MKSQEELVDHIRSVIAANRDPLGFKREAAFEFLTHEQIHIVCPEVDIARIEGERRPYTREAVLECMRTYMTFAWEKAHDERGISAGRSIEKFEVWVWMLGDYEQIDWRKYAMYGKPILRQICERYDFPIEFTT